MEFKKIDDKKFQCLLFEEDLEENNISLDDFFRNDTEKIHGLLDVVMEEARKEIGIAPSGEMISLQLAPQPNNSLLLTVSSGGDDISDMLRQAGKRAAKALSSMSPKENNIIKNSDDRRKKSKKPNLKVLPSKTVMNFLRLTVKADLLTVNLQYADFQNGLNLKDSVHRAEEHGVSVTHFIRIILMFILFLKEEDAQL